MDETNRVLARLRRIEELREGAEFRKGAQASALLDELRALVPEAEAWARADGDARARVAATKLREEAEGMR
jgi:Tfp pilus assembly protein PilN